MPHGNVALWSDPEMSDLGQIMPFVYVVTGLCFAGFFLTKITDYLKTAKNANVRAASKGGTPQRPFSALIENSETIISELHKLRAAQIKDGATPESLKSLDQRIHLAEWGAKNKGWLQYIAPYGDELAGVVLQGIKGLVRGMS